MKKLLLIILFITGSVLYAQTGVLRQWQNTNSANGNFLHDLAVDPAENSYYCMGKIIGPQFRPNIIKYNSSGALMFEKALNFPSYPAGVRPSAGIVMDNQNNLYIAGTMDSMIAYRGFLAKLDQNGDSIWTRTIGLNDTNKFVKWYGITIDASGNIYVTGSKAYIVPFITTNIYTAKYSPSGNLLWVKERVLANSYVLHNIKTPMMIDNNGDLIIGLTLKSSNPSSQDQNMAFIKYNSSGDELWFTTYDNPGQDNADILYGMDIDNSGNIYAGGSSLITANNTGDFTVLKLNASGVLQWTYKTRGDITGVINLATSISVNKPTGELYAVGILRSNAPVSNEAVTIKLDPAAGTQIWEKSYQNLFNENGLSSMLDNNGNIIMGGTVASGSNYYAFLAKLNPSGNFIWTKQSSNLQLQPNIVLLKKGSNNSAFLGFTVPTTPTVMYASKYIDVVPQSQTFCRSVNLPIMDNQSAFDTVNVTGLPPQAVVISVQVKVDTIQHTNSPELTGVLRSPQGIADTLFKNPGFGNFGFDMINCLITDTASAQLNNSALPPFTGSYRPYAPLSIYEGTELNGKWVFSVSDNFTNNTGTLKKYCLIINYYDLATIGIQQVSNEVPENYLLGQNYPNPFNPTTNIKFSIPKSGNVTLKVFDILGKQVAELVNEYKSTGSYVVDFNAANLSSGIYFYRLETEGLIETKKMLLVK